MASDRGDAIVLTWRPVGATVPRRTRLEPRADGRWVRVVEFREGDRWREAYRVVVERLNVDTAE